MGHIRGGGLGRGYNRKKGLPLILKRGVCGRDLGDKRPVERNTRTERCTPSDSFHEDTYDSPVAAEILENFCLLL